MNEPLTMSDLGMAKLFMLPSEAVSNVLVKGDLIISEANRKTIMTRSKTKSSGSPSVMAEKVLTYRSESVHSDRLSCQSTETHSA